MKALVLCSERDFQDGINGSGIDWGVGKGIRLGNSCDQLFHNAKWALKVKVVAGGLAGAVGGASSGVSFGLPQSLRGGQAPRLLSHGHLGPQVAEPVTFARCDTSWHVVEV